MQSNPSDIWQFLFYSKEMVKKLVKKSDFLAHWVTPQFSAKLNVLWSSITAVSLISVAFAFCDCQVINFQMFSCWCSIHEMALFFEGKGGGGGDFWALSFPNIAQFCWYFNKRWSLKRQRQCLNNLWNFAFKQKRDILKIYSFHLILGTTLVKEFLL